MGGAASCSLVSVARYGPASSSGIAASKIDSAWPNFIAPPLSSPRTLKSCSAVRAWTSAATYSADLPPTRLPRPSAVRPAYPKGNVASLAVRITALRGNSLTVSLSRAGFAVAQRMGKPPVALDRRPREGQLERKIVGHWLAIQARVNDHRCGPGSHGVEGALERDGCVWLERSSGSKLRQQGRPGGVPVAAVQV